MAEPSSHSGTAKFAENSTHNCKEKVATSVREPILVPLKTDKENRVRKGSEGSTNVVSRLTMHYDEISSSQKNVVATAVENPRVTGAIKKSVASGEKKSFGSSKRVDFGAGTKKRVKFNVGENDVFAKSRFDVYADEQLPTSQESATKISARNFNENATAENIIRDRTLNRLLPESSVTGHARLTPIDVSGVPLIPKKVKVQHRKGLMTARERPNNYTESIAQGLAGQLSYEDNFVSLELEKEKPMSRMSRGFQRMNITVEQRKIVVKFLTRLNAHSFYPSFFLYQTVRIFDAVLDATLTPLEDIQLVALAALWIVLKREQIGYKVPSAATMISYAKDLYEGRVDLLLKCEKKILQSLNFEIVFPDPFSILYYYITTCKRSEFLQKNQMELAYYCGSYMIDLSLFDEDLMKKSVVLLAAAAAETALFFAAEEEKYEPWWFKWRAPDAVSRYSDVEIGDVRSTLIERINESHQRHSDYEIVFKKYNRSRYGRISKFLCNKVKLFLGVD